MEGRQTEDRLEGQGRASTAVSNETIGRIENLITRDQRITVREIASNVEIGHAAIDTILQNHLHVNKVSARWASRSFTPDMKHERTETSRDLPRIADEEGP